MGTEFKEDKFREGYWNWNVFRGLISSVKRFSTTLRMREASTPFAGTRPHGPKSKASVQGQAHGSREAENGWALTLVPAWLALIWLLGVALAMSAVQLQVAHPGRCTLPEGRENKLTA